MMKDRKQYQLMLSAPWLKAHKQVGKPMRSQESALAFLRAHQGSITEQCGGYYYIGSIKGE